MTTPTIDPYRTLGIPAGASRDEAARAHRRLAKRYHPDLNRGPAAAERMRRINEAWRILSNPARRSRYDAERTVATAGHWAGSAGTRPRTTTTWTTWPESRRSGTRVRRPTAPQPIEPSMGDHPAVVVGAWVILSLLLFVGTWLGSIVR